MGILEINSANIDSYVERIVENKTTNFEFDMLVRGRFNLFMDDVFKKYLFFRGDDKSSINEFWNHFLIEKPYESNALYDCVALVYKLSYVTSILGIKSLIVFEENDENVYFTLKASKELAREILARQIQKSRFGGEYIISEESVSFKLQKTAEKIEFLPQKKAAEQHPESLDDESIEELKEGVKKISSLILFFRFGIEKEEVSSLSKELLGVAKTLSKFACIYEVAEAIKTLSELFERQKETVSLKSGYIFGLLEAFGQDFERWVEEVLKDARPSVNAFADMLVSNIAIISSRIEPPSQTRELRLEEVFNF